MEVAEGRGKSVCALGGEWALSKADQSELTRNRHPKFFAELFSVEAVEKRRCDVEIPAIHFQKRSPKQAPHGAHGSERQRLSVSARHADSSLFRFLPPGRAAGGRPARGCPPSRLAGIRSAGILCSADSTDSRSQGGLPRLLVWRRLYRPQTPQQLRPFRSGRRQDFPDPARAAGGSRSAGGV